MILISKNIAYYLLLSREVVIIVLSWINFLINLILMLLLKHLRNKIYIKGCKITSLKYDSNLTGRLHFRWLTSFQYSSISGILRITLYIPRSFKYNTSIFIYKIFQCNKIPKKCTSVWFHLTSFCTKRLIEYY